jgi:predicted transcriptional regulator
MAASHAIVVQPDQQERLEKLAAAQLRSPELLVREAIDQYLEFEQLQTPDERARMLADAEASWQEHQRTGLHVTHDEVRDWIHRLHDDPNAPPPECHT